MEKRYTVTQAAGVLGVKSYVLRYWEDELELRIHRNEQGHRYYTDFDITLFANIKELKNRGLQLRAIKELIPQISRTVPGTTESKIKLLTGEHIDSDIVDEPDKEPEDEKILEFQQILERLIAQEIQMKREGEGRCRSLDEAIRRRQTARKEAAAALDKKCRRKQNIRVYR